MPGFSPPPGRVPESLDTERFVLRPLTPAHAELDHAAVMSRRGRLRRWSGTRWPADDFTVEENRRDLDRHRREHEAGEAFTYTVLTPDERRCLGCVYVISTDASDPAPEGSAVVGWWAIDDDLEAALLERLLAWFDDDWTFPAVYYSAREVDDGQMELLRRPGLAVHRRLEVPGRDGTFVLFGPG